MPCTPSPSPTICAIDIRGDSAPNGSWKTTCISRRSGRSPRAESPWQSLPGEANRGPAHACSRSRASPSVVLPEPLSPTTPTVCPSRTVTLTPSTALT